MFSADSTTAVRGVDKLIPVDLYLPGCPPRPEAIFDAVIKLRKKVGDESLAERRNDHGKNGSINADLLNTEMIRLEAVVIKSLLVEPLAHRTRLGSNNRTRVIRGGCLLGRGFAHDSTGSAAGVSTAASVAKV